MCTPTVDVGVIMANWPIEDAVKLYRLLGEYLFEVTPEAPEGRLKGRFDVPPDVMEEVAKLFRTNPGSKISNRARQKERYLLKLRLQRRKAILRDTLAKGMLASTSLSSNPPSSPLSLTVAPPPPSPQPTPTSSALQPIPLTPPKPSELKLSLEQLKKEAKEYLEQVTGSGTPELPKNFLLDCRRLVIFCRDRPLKRDKSVAWPKGQNWVGGSGETVLMRSHSYGDCTDSAIATHIFGDSGAGRILRALALATRKKPAERKRFARAEGTYNNPCVGFDWWDLNEVAEKLGVQFQNHFIFDALPQALRSKTTEELGQFVGQGELVYPLVWTAKQKTKADGGEDGRLLKHYDIHVYALVHKDRFKPPSKQPSKTLNKR